MKQRIQNKISAVFAANSENEALSRILVAGFLMPYSLSVEELSDIKTAVSEAVTNAVVHAYRDRAAGDVHLSARLSEDGRLTITVVDRGMGIADVERAREPFSTTERELERGGMGFSIMETFMDSVRVTSREGRGTRVVLKKRLTLS